MSGGGWTDVRVELQALPRTILREKCRGRILDEAEILPLVKSLSSTGYQLV
jgi:hypothetical protein